MRSCVTLGISILALVAGLSHSALAQLAIGPIPYRQNVNGVLVTVNVLSFVTVQTAPGSLAVTAKVDGDLFDLQQKIGTIVDTLNCHPTIAPTPVPTSPIRWCPSRASR